ncbi:hypothetical protein Sjap_021507 [Stephania japonica]|uniref:Uncharacterized protein n=1 Tax=Stephania japonica TaxID=461633 RepID=A0AAP0EM38_9MAGN
MGRNVVVIGRSNIVGLPTCSSFLGYCIPAIVKKHGYLTCEAGMKILFGTTKALTYLHEAIEPKMVHRGFGNTRSQISASFASDGKHIVFASEDSNVYVWNYNNQDGSAPSHVKSTRCREHFFSNLKHCICCYSVVGD